MGIVEDAATGSAAGPLGVYLLRHAKARSDGDHETRIRLEQGVEMGRPSRIEIAISGTAEQIEDVRRDQKTTEQALAALQEVVDRFPGTSYARDAALKIDLTRDHLAGKDMEIGRWYEDRLQYLAAINRFRSVVEKYQTTSHVPEALERLTECYLALGVTDEAQTAAAVLGYNYPGSSWYQVSYDLLKAKNLKPENKPGSWLNDVF